MATVEGGGKDFWPCPSSAVQIGETKEDSSFSFSNIFYIKKEEKISTRLRALAPFLLDYMKKPGPGKSQT